MFKGPTLTPTMKEPQAVVPFVLPLKDGHAGVRWPLSCC